MRLDAGKARRQLGWQPLCPIGEALERSVDWYRAAARGEDMRSASLAEIARHEAAIGALGTS